MSSNGKCGPHNTKKAKGVAADQPKRWLGDCAASFEAALAPTDYDDRLFFDPDELLFSASDDNVDVHDIIDLVSFPTELVDYETDHAHVPIRFQARNDVVLALPAQPYSRSAGSDASVNSYAVVGGGDDDDRRRHERDNGLFEELWEVVDAAAGRWRGSEK